jgi:methionine synthase II (cobalamin-independent)
MSATAEQPSLVGVGTGVGSLPGTDEREAARFVAGELPEMPFLPELPERGAGAHMIGRTCTLLVDMHVDLQPAGWRLVPGESQDERRARAQLRRDLDEFEEAAHRADRFVKVAVAGPLTLATWVERPRGDRVLADHGARRELAQSLAEGVAAFTAEVAGRFALARPVVQIDEPMLTAAMAGQVPTASGFSRHRAVGADEARASLRAMADAVRSGGGTPMLHSCSRGLDVGLVRDAGMEALSFDVSTLERMDGQGLRPDVDADAWSEAAEAGMVLFVGAVPAVDPAGRPPDAVAMTSRVLRWWGWLGFDESLAAQRLSVTPTCGLAGASPSWARQALALSRQVAGNLAGEPVQVPDDERE